MRSADSVLASQRIFRVGTCSFEYIWRASKYALIVPRLRLLLCMSLSPILWSRRCDMTMLMSTVCFAFDRSNPPAESVAYMRID